jgi:Zn-dependent peptidase ImmA (M78 family)
MARHELGAYKLDAFSQWERSDDTPHIILGADKGSAARSRYDAAHELGHMILHRKILEGTLHHTDQFALIEDQAHRFAGAFLLPRRTFSEEFYSASLDVLRSLKAKWKVSIAAMIKRAGQLRLIDDEQERRLWINLSRRGWRLREPLDDELEPEEPRVLRRAVELLVNSSTIQRHEVVFQLSLTPKDVEDLVGLPSGYLSEATGQVELLTFPVVNCAHAGRRRGR